MSGGYKNGKFYVIITICVVILLFCGFVYLTKDTGLWRSVARGDASISEIFADVVNRDKDAETPQPEPEAAQPTVIEAEVPEVSDGGMSPAVEYEDDNLALPDVSRQKTAESAFFDKAAFLGNNTLLGLQGRDCFGEAEWFFGDAATAVGAGGFLEDMSGGDYDKVYIEFGLNELGTDSEVFRADYSALLDEIQSLWPKADIYIMSLAPVSLWRTQNSETYTRERVRLFNETLHSLAEARGVYYLDIYAALSNDDGYLPSEVTNDGLSFDAMTYKTLADYLITHYIP